MSEWVRAFIGLGANLGDPVTQVRCAMQALDRLPDTRVAVRSRLYRTAPWGVVDQPDFINAVAAVDTTLSAKNLLQALLACEATAGRTRAGRRWGPRVLDLDLLLYGEGCIVDDALEVPHPRMAERAFVLVPLAEIAPDALVPGKGCVRDLLVDIDGSDCVPLESAD